MDRLEVDLRYGAFVVRQSDLYFEDVFQVPLTRTYFSSDWIDVDRPHSFGHNTSHPYDLEPLGSRNPYTYLNLVFEDGVPLYFGRISAGTDFADAVYMHTDTSTRFYQSTIAWNGNGWTLHLPDGSSMIFPEAYESKTVAQGAVTQLLDGRGNRLRLNRDQEGLLESIETPHGRHIRFTYDERKLITKLEDEQARHVTYRYSEAGMLTDVISTSGSQRHYDYDGTRMTSVSDEHGRVLVKNTYQAGVLVRQEYGTGEVMQYSYRFARGASDVEEAVVTLPDLSTHTVRLPLPLRSE